MSNKLEVEDGGSPRLKRSVFYTCGGGEHATRAVGVRPQLSRALVGTKISKKIIVMKVY
jgi:hypothetical protein